MKLLPSKPFIAFSSSAALIAALTFTLHNGGVALWAQDPPAAPPAAPGAAAKGTGAPKGKGRAATDTLGEGPWDLKSELTPIHVSVITKGLDHPWGLAILPNGDMLVTERPGRLRLVHNGVLDPTPLGPLPEIRVRSLGGLLDIALHPKFAENHLIYFTYVKPGKDDPAHATTAVGRARYDGGTTLTDVKDIFVANAWFGGAGAPKGCCGQGPSDGNSHGSRMVFDHAGLLYVTSGDRNYGELAQDPSTDIGKILRIRDDGTIPPDNPFVGKPGYLPEIYCIGVRNPLGLTVHPVTGEIWESEFGPRGGDEVNLLKAGKNYGWIIVTKGEHYNGDPSEKTHPGMEDPVLHWEPVIDPGNLAFYYADKFPMWKGNLVMATMTRSVLRATFDDKGNPTGQERMLTELKQRIRDLRIGADGYIYLLTDETFGALLRMEPGK
ncbi:MAG TPA: PQQ-dependent sugar dehydrogenase [Bryobacteraceae bacterium]|jgi:glucose/arabinose dehydrogenase